MTQQNTSRKLVWALLGVGLVVSCKTKQKPAENLPISQIICATQPTDKSWYSSGQKAPLFDSLGNLDFPITTTSEEVQRYFNQGLMLAVGFNHAEAARSFYEATRLDSTCAMAHWGFAYVLGPNYNAGMEPDNYQRAHAAVQRAVRLSAQSTEKEKALVAALAERYPAQPVDDRSPYDRAYSQALAQVHRRFPDDPNIAALYAESIMDLHPWDLWDKEGKARPWTPEIVEKLEDLLARYSDHIAAHHFYIHAVEASKTPERGLKSAEVLGKLAPNASHLVHMPSHIYIRTGNYHRGSVVNQKAVEADSAYLVGCHAQGAFPLVYFPHNYHFLAATATLEGNSEWAMLSADKVAENTNKRLMSEPGWGTLQHYYSIPYHVAIKFGQWDEILRRTKADTVALEYPTAIRNYARGMALANQKKTTEAEAELRKLDRLVVDPEIAQLTIWEINSMATILQIARRVLNAEILSQKGDFDAGIKLLREAVALEDQLNYNEPPDWFFSVRHNLGGVLLKAKRYAEAEAVYQQDLAEFPQNGWALSGLYEAQRNQGVTQKAERTKAALDKAWQWADGALKKSGGLSI